MRLGLKPEMLAGILNSSSGRCWSSDTYNPVAGVCPAAPANRDYNGGFTVPLMAKVPPLPARPFPSQRSAYE